MFKIKSSLLSATVHVFRVRSRKRVLAASLLAASAALFTAAPEAQAANVNVPALICRPASPDPNNELNFGLAGVTNMSPNIARKLECAIPRPDVTGDTVVFYVDGSNPVGRTTACSLSAQNFNGDIVGTKVFTITTAGDFDKRVEFTSAQMPKYAYLSVACTLPSLGSLYGVIAMD